MNDVTPWQMALIICRFRSPGALVGGKGDNLQLLLKDERKPEPNLAEVSN